MEENSCEIISKSTSQVDVKESSSFLSMIKREREREILFVSKLGKIFEMEEKGQKRMMEDTLERVVPGYTLITKDSGRVTEK